MLCLNRSLHVCSTPAPFLRERRWQPSEVSHPSGIPSYSVTPRNAMACYSKPPLKSSSRSSSFPQTWLGFASQPPSQSLKHPLRAPPGRAAFRLGGSGLRSCIYKAGPRPGAGTKGIADIFPGWRSHAWVSTLTCGFTGLRVAHVCWTLTVSTKALFTFHPHLCSIMWVFGCRARDLSIH